MMELATKRRADGRGTKHREFLHAVTWALLACALIDVPTLSDMAYAQAVAIERIAVTVSDIDKTELFYRDGLGFKTLARRLINPPDSQTFGGSTPAEVLTMRLGAEEVEFIHFAKAGRHYPSDSSASDLWFQHLAIVVSDMHAAYARLQNVKYRPISLGGPQILPKSDGRVQAFKFRDPDGHPLELIYFPVGQGRAVWGSKRQGVIDLGIDHTAISVSQTPASLAFYFDLLGMKVAYRTVNQGVEQERLDNVVGSRVRITGLRPKSHEGAGLELLDYRSLPRGRPAPRGSQIIDDWHAHVVVMVDGLDALVAKLRRHRVRFVSSASMSLIEGRRAIAISDPDGHDLVLVRRKAEDRPL